jgi:hypothetical protein
MTGLSTFAEIFVFYMLGSLPTLLVFVVGIIIAVRNLKFKPLASKYALAGFVSLLLIMVGGWITEFIVSYYSSSTLITYSSYSFSLSYCLYELFQALSYSLLLRAIFVSDHQKISRTQLRQILEDE